MKKLKRFLSLFTAASILLAFASCGKEDENPTTATQTQPETVTQEITEEVTQTSTEFYTELSTAEQESATEQETTEWQTTLPEKIDETTTEPAPEPSVIVTKPTVTTTKPVVVPSEKAKIVKLYNNAAAAASKGKPGYGKTVNTTLSNINMGALSNLGVVKEAVGNFLGEGQNSTTVKKGSFDGSSLVNSTLKSEDVLSATCRLSADRKYYIVDITVKSETNPLKGSSALGRFTKDYKDVDEIRSGMTEAGAKVDTISITTSSVKISAKISVEDNRFVSLTHSFKMSAKLTNVKYTIARVKTATANLSTTVEYKNFKY